MRQKPLDWGTVLLALWVSAITTKIILVLTGRPWVSNEDVGFVWLAVFSALIGAATFIEYQKDLPKEPKEKGIIHVITPSLESLLANQWEGFTEAPDETQKAMVKEFMSKVEELVKAYTAPNATNNVSIEYAVRFGNWMKDLGMEYSHGIFAYPTNAQGAPIMSVADLIAAGVPEQMVLNLYGTVPQGTPAENAEEPVEPKGYNIGLETLLIKGLDPETQFAKLYAEHNPGTTAQDAALAMEELLVMQVSAEQVLTDLKTHHGILV